MTHDAHSQEVIYLTGLSIDKGRLHKLFKQIATDPDFSDFILAVSSQVVERDFFEVAKAKLKKTYYRYDIANKINDFAGVFNKDIIKLAETYVTGNTLSALRALKLLFFDVGMNHYLNISGQTVSPSLEKLNNDIKQFFGTKSIRDQLSTYENLDFFRIYLSNQSDSRGVPALASGDIKENECYTVNWGYADGPFYNNEFVDSLYFQFTESLNDKVDISNIDSYGNKKDDIATILSTLFESIYFMHGADIIASRILSDRGANYDLSNEDKTQWWSNFNQKLKSDRNQEDFVKSMGDRALFGIDLLSRIFATLLDVLKDNQILNLYLDSDGFEEEYIYELVEYANSPGEMAIIDDRNQADIVISSQMLPSYHMSGNRPNWFYEGKNSEEHESLRAKNNFPFFIKREEPNESVTAIALKIPVKMFVSLPFVSGKPSRNALLPSQLVYSDIDAVENKILNVLTVGGAEHNRPLMRLVNKARQDYKENRMFGFMDNIFDFAHRLQYEKDRSYRHLFVMGVNQPVSGFNQILATRLNDDSGQSISKLAKQLYFETHCEFLDRTIHVLCIYGFSAATSSYTTSYSILKMKAACREGSNETISLAMQGIMDLSETEDRKHIRDYQGRGISVLLEYKTDIDDKINKASEDFDYFSGIRIPKIRQKLEKVFRFSAGLTPELDEGIKDRILGRVSDE